MITQGMLEQQHDLEEEMRAVTIDRYFSLHEKAAEEIRG